MYNKIYNKMYIYVICACYVFRFIGLPSVNFEVRHPRCVCENWKGYVVKHNCVN